MPDIPTPNGTHRENDRRMLLSVEWRVKLGLGSKKKKKKSTGVKDIECFIEGEAWGDVWKIGWVSRLQGPRQNLCEIGRLCEV